VPAFCAPKDDPSSQSEGLRSRSRVGIAFENRDEDGKVKSIQHQAQRPPLRWPGAMSPRAMGGRTTNAMLALRELEEHGIGKGETE